MSATQGSSQTPPSGQQPWRQSPWDSSQPPVRVDPTSPTPSPMLPGAPDFIAPTASPHRDGTIEPAPLIPPMYPQQGFPAAARSAQPYPPLYPPVSPTTARKPRDFNDVFMTIPAAIIMVIILITTVVGGLFFDHRKEQLNADLVKTAAHHPRLVVDRYMQALAAGKAQVALQEVSRLPDDKSLLTDQVLKDSLKRAPITAITIGDVVTTNRREFYVSVNFKLGDKDVSHTHLLDRRGGRMKIIDGTYQLSMTRYQNFPMTINGVKPDTIRAEVFPGSYLVHSTTPYFQIGDGQPLLVMNHAVELSAPALTDQGLGVFRQKIKASVQECLASMAIAGGCGLDLSRGVPGLVLKENTIHRSLSDAGRAKLDSVTPKLIDARPLLVTINETIPGLSSWCECSQDGVAGTCTLQRGSAENFAKPYLDFSKPELPLTWERI